MARELFDATKACAVCGYPVPEHSVLCSAGRPESVEMCPCGDMSDRECREANRKAAEASGSVCCARFRDSAPALPPSHPRAGEDVDVDAVESLNEAHPDYRLTQRLIESVEQGTRTDEIMDQAAILSEFTTLRARLAAVEGERERVMADYASELAMIFADRKANRMELLAKAAAVEEQVRLHEATIERQAEAIGILQRAESEAERRGAERALRWAWSPETRVISTEGHYVRAGLAALYPAPATDTQGVGE